MTTWDEFQGCASTAIKRAYEATPLDMKVVIAAMVACLAILLGTNDYKKDTVAISELTKDGCLSLGKPEALDAQAIILGANPDTLYNDVVVAKKGKVLLMDDAALTATRIDQICALRNAVKDPSTFALVAPNMRDPASVAALHAAHITFVSDAKDLPKNITQLSEKLSPDSLAALTLSAVTQGIASANRHMSAYKVIPKGQLAQIPQRNIASIARV
ncbi:MAG TPA: hypothetical protein VGZ00_00905 [Candidatus Baltobacteraceae bacterium]|jgi:hypothetical protein|nr:hypothetical protein [Candidatus Baltobacteraceae bacterium]